MAGEAAIGYHTLRAERVNDVFVTLVVEIPLIVTLYTPCLVVFTLTLLSLSPCSSIFSFFLLKRQLLEDY